MRTIELPQEVSLDQLSWRVCHATQDYEVSEYGHVRRRTPGRKTWPGKILSFCWHAAGYPRYKLTINGQHEHFECHRLVAFAFLGAPKIQGDEVAHIDGNPRNNHYSNLSWKSHRENEADKVAHGTSSRGSRNGMAKLTESAVLAMREQRSSGKTLSEIARSFGVAFQTVSKVTNGDRWRHV